MTDSFKVSVTPDLHQVGVRSGVAALHQFNVRCRRPIYTGCVLSATRGGLLQSRDQLGPDLSLCPISCPTWLVLCPDLSRIFFWRAPHLRSCDGSEMHRTHTHADWNGILSVPPREQQRRRNADVCLLCCFFFFFHISLQQPVENTQNVGILWKTLAGDWMNLLWEFFIASWISW